MKHFRSLILASFILKISGCAYGPINNSDFNQSLSLNNLVGSYTNRMEGPDNHDLLLSTLIWPYPDELEYKDLIAIHEKRKHIDLIAISLQKSKILFQAIDENCAVVEKSIEIEDRFKDGQFVLNSHYQNWSSVHIGPNFTKETLGLDSENNLKWRRIDRAGGLAFWIIPFAIFESRDYRAQKISDNFIYQSCQKTASQVKQITEE